MIIKKARHFIRLILAVNNVGYLLLLTGFFILIELAFFILCNDSYLHVFSFISSRIHLPLSIVPGIAFYLFAQLLIHFIFCLCVAVIASGLIALLRIKQSKQLLFSISVWLIGLVGVLLANAHYYPNSRFAQLMAFDTESSQATSMRWAPHVVAKHTQFTSAATTAQPNIIIVGIDSLRPTILNFFGGEVEAPFINRFLTKATVFSEAVTPLARTYPSWVGILTGEYPVQSGVRTNLGGIAKTELSHTISSILRERGYQTIYATDETRFSNIDKHFGFDETITPPIGTNDFLLGTFSDFPLSNLVTNTWLGKWLFPYSYANRPAYITYDPNSFINQLQDALLRDHSKPLFLAVHFCLPHHPYLFAAMNGNQMTGQARYMLSIERADQQVSDFFALLENANLLKHAMVILLSDHGEALEWSGDRLTEREAYLPAQRPAPIYYPSSEDNLAMNQSVGHGTDVLGLPQYHSLLAFKLYGLGKQREAVVSGIVSLLDIKQTICSLDARRPGESRDPVNNASRLHASISLLPYILGISTTAPTRMIYLESDFSPDALRTVYPETRKLLLEGADLFQINPTTARVSVKDEMLAMIIKSKQYAVLYGDWMLALYPQTGHTRLPILISLKSGAWTTDLRTPFAQLSPARQMYAGLKQFYGKEID